MTERADDTNDRNDPSRPEGQNTSEAMDNKTEHDNETTAVLPSAETPPTQEITQATQRLPEGPAPEGPAPEGEVHPAYGAAAARVQEESAAAAVQDAPAHDDSDPLAPLRDPEPQAPAAATAAASAHGPTQRTSPQRPVPPRPAQAQPAQPAQAAAQAAALAAAKRGPRVGTAVWGLIVIAVGLGILAVAAGVVFDIATALIVLLGAAGVILVVGSVVSSLRRR